MKIYLAGNVGVIERERRNEKLYNNRLFSYFYILPGEIEHEVFEWLKSYLRESQEADHLEIV